MNVVFCSSDLYAKCTGIAINSLLTNNTDLKNLSVYVLTTDMSEKHKEMLIQMCKSFQRELIIIDALEALEDAQRELNLSAFKGGLNTYARAMANRILPKSLDRVLFVDSDIMFDGSIASLENLDMGENIVAGVYEIALMIKNLCYEDIDLLNQCPHYINYGVVYIDLENWRKHHGDDLIAKCVAASKKPFRIAEQSILNLSFKDHTMILPVKFNFYTILHGVSYETINKWYQRKKVFEEDEFTDASRNPVIVHFIGDYFNRPWYKNNICRFKDRYMVYYNSSPWGTEPLDDEPRNLSKTFKLYYMILIWLRKNGHDNAYFKLRYVIVQWLREHIPNLDGRIKRRV